MDAILILLGGIGMLRAKNSAGALARAVANIATAVLAFWAIRVGHRLRRRRQRLQRLRLIPAT